MDAGISGCVSYYEGIPGWSAAYPEKTLLRGKPVSESNKLISEEEFKKRCLPFEAFQKGIADNGNAMVFDVRDHIQKTGQLPGINKKVLSTPIDIFIPNVVRKKLNQDKVLYIFDQVGKQVESLQYDLLENGYVNFWFLEKGATGVLGKQEYKK